jgi:hypothetical protein
MNQRATAAKRGAEKSPASEIVSRRFKVCPAVSKLVNQIPDANVQGFGNPHQGENTGRFFTPFQFTHVNRMQFGSFGQFYLAQFGKFATPFQASRKRAKSTQCIALYFYLARSQETV